MPLSGDEETSVLAVLGDKGPVALLDRAIAAIPASAPGPGLCGPAWTLDADEAWTTTPGAGRLLQEPRRRPSRSQGRLNGCWLDARPAAPRRCRHVLDLRLMGCPPEPALVVLRGQRIDRLASAQSERGRRLQGFVHSPPAESAGSQAGGPIVFGKWWWRRQGWRPIVFGKWWSQQGWRTFASGTRCWRSARPGDLGCDGSGQLGGASGQVGGEHLGREGRAFVDGARKLTPIGLEPTGPRRVQIRPPLTAFAGLSRGCGSRHDGCDRLVASDDARRGGWQAARPSHWHRRRPGHQRRTAQSVSCPLCRACSMNRTAVAVGSPIA
jgi:hypothetical protein